MDGTQVYRSAGARAIAVATWVTTLVLAGGQLLAGPLDAVSTYAVVAGTGLAAVVAWVALWRPHVEVAPHGVVLHDPLRTVLVTWPGLQQVDGRFGLRLVAGGRHWSAWAAAPPGGRDRRAGVDSEAAALVRREWERVRDRGLLDSGTVEGRGVTATREVVPTTALVAGVVALGVLALLA